MIRKAYRELIRRCHPDRNNDIAAPTQARRINEAYAVLNDIEKRQRYDASQKTASRQANLRPKDAHPLGIYVRTLLAILEPRVVEELKAVGQPSSQYPSKPVSIAELKSRAVENVVAKVYPYYDPNVNETIRLLCGKLADTILKPK